MEYSIARGELSPRSKAEHNSRRRRRRGPSREIALIGTPNVGKSALFNILTGGKAVVSNYPGTTVEVTRGRLSSCEVAEGVVDTPGMYSLMPITEEERIARRLLLEERPDLILHVIDAKNLKRMLNLTLQLIEAGLPVIAVVNMIDEAKRLGIEIDFQKLENILGIPVVPTSAATGEGIERLKRILEGAPFYSKRQRRESAQNPPITYDPWIEERVTKIEELLSNSYPL
ncbi:MAG: FeoB small GTPase domain-containing protein, partial [Thermacetogeniaceae bacterium]